MSIFFPWWIASPLIADPTYLSRNGEVSRVYFLCLVIHYLSLVLNSAITAFPVLARILTELDLLNNEVGVVVLSAGVGNDVW